MRDLARLERQLAEYDERLPDDGSVRVAFACAEVDDEADPDAPDGRRRLRDLIGQALASSAERPLARLQDLFAPKDVPPGGT